MRVAIISIGNSKGIRIPKALLEQCGLEESAELRVERGNLIISPSKQARQGWDEAFQKLARGKGS